MAKAPKATGENTLSLKERIVKNSTIAETALIQDSTVYGKKDTISTGIPMIDAALSGDVDGGLTPGVTVIAGPSKHFKSKYALEMAAAFIRKYPEGLILFYDSEFGTPENYFADAGIPLDQVIHTPVTTIEDLRHDMVVQLTSLTRKDKVFIILDSLGNLASKKETVDALDGSDKADMTRAKVIKSFFRIVTPQMTLKDISFIVINHIYMEMGLYPKAIVSGGSGPYLSADNIWIVGRQVERVGEGGPVKGFKFVINIEKSRYVREKTKFPITVSYEEGILRYSGLLAYGLEGGYVAKPKVGWYQVVDRDTGELVGKMYREADLDTNAEFWHNIFDTTDFKEWLKTKITLQPHERLAQQVAEDPDDDEDVAA